jgi:hypothetical protein
MTTIYWGCFSHVSPVAPPQQIPCITLTQLFDSTSDRIWDILTAHFTFSGGQRMPTQLALAFEAVPITCEIQKRYHSITPCLAGISTPAEQAQALNLGYSTITR